MLILFISYEKQRDFQKFSFDLIRETAFYINGAYILLCLVNHAICNLEQLSVFPQLYPRQNLPSKFLPNFVYISFFGKFSLVSSVIHW